MAKRNLASMSVDALLKLRGDLDAVLRQRANELNLQLSRLSRTRSANSEECESAQ